MEGDGQDQVVKKLVRYALACEYQRVSIKRTGIAEKGNISFQMLTNWTHKLVIGKQRGAFKKVFESAQKQLRNIYGMEMVELPTREKVTMKEKRGSFCLYLKSSSHNVP